MTDKKASQARPNRLIHATSPYLLQHADNPVEWFEWGKEALAKALAEDKPLLVSIGYSSCHWCHVMERESFENPEIAKLMNHHFVCIKVDREERPDIDQVYMDAVQAMGTPGGWPLNVFLTPNQRPFFGGTYFPPDVWRQVLQKVNEAYCQNREKVTEAADELARIVSTEIASRVQTDSREIQFDQGIDEIYSKLDGEFDRTWGGFERSPKFVMPSVWHWILRYHHLKGKQKVIEQIELTLSKIADGGIYDHVGGGFARYSVDAQWFVPHFEKMLYDNAQLVSLYSEAFARTGKGKYKKTVYETFQWLNREMTHPEGGFYSASDADSEGVEGKFYTWTKDEIQKVLRQDAELFCERFGVTEAGNWENGQNILKKVGDDEEFCRQKNLTAMELQDIVDRCKTSLLKERENRVRPARDDKMLAGWNAMMTGGLVDAYHAFADDSFRAAAESNMVFIERRLMDGERLFRSYKDRRSNAEGFLEDYAYVIRACIKLYQAGFDEKWLHKANRLAECAIRGFYDAKDGLFFFTSQNAEKLLARKKELFDNVIPASNGIMAMNLFHLGIMLGKDQWRKMAKQMVDGLSSLIVREPGNMSNWGIADMEINLGMDEVVVLGENAIQRKNTLAQHFLPFAIFAGAESTSSMPMLKGKTPIDNKDTIYVCRNCSCRQPVHQPEEALKLIKH